MECGGITAMLHSFVSRQGAGLCVIDEETRRLVFADPLLRDYLGPDLEGRLCHELLAGCSRPCGNCPELPGDGRAYEWEMMRNGSPPRLFRLRQCLREQEGRRYRVCQVMDISDYVGLSSEIISYMLLFKQLAAFQTDVMEHLGDSFPELLALIMEHFQADRLLLLRRRDTGDIQSYLFGPGAYRAAPDFRPEEAASLFRAGEQLCQPLSTLPEPVARLLTQVCGAPIRTASLFPGQLTGETYTLVMINSHSPLHLGEMDTTLFNVVRMYIENGILRENIIRDAELDRLTGLYNHSKFLACLEREFRGGPGFGVLYFDINDLKYINDNFGHEAGDHLLRRAAEGIRGLTDRRIRGFRIGGDEFAVIVPDSSEAELAALQAACEHACLGTGDPGGPPCLMSFGMALGEAGETAESVIRRADAAMYMDKKHKKGRARMGR